MRIWHLIFAVCVVALMLTIYRDPVGRVALIVFITALGEVVFGTTAVLALFQTVGDLGETRSLYAHVEAIAATALVLVIATAIMSIWLFCGAWLVKVTLP
jgi:hypothetical protein